MPIGGRSNIELLYEVYAPRLPSGIKQVWCVHLRRVGQPFPKRLAERLARKGVLVEVCICRRICIWATERSQVMPSCARLLPTAVQSVKF